MRKTTTLLTWKFFFVAIADAKQYTKRMREIQKPILMLPVLRFNAVVPTWFTWRTRFVTNRAIPHNEDKIAIILPLKRALINSTTPGAKADQINISAQCLGGPSINCSIPLNASKNVLLVSLGMSPPQTLNIGTKITFISKAAERIISGINPRVILPFFAFSGATSGLSLSDSVLLCCGWISSCG